MPNGDENGEKLRRYQQMADHDILVELGVRQEYMGEALDDVGKEVKSNSTRLTAQETKCHETRTTVFNALERRSNGSRRPPKKYVAGGVSVIVVMGSLGYAAGRIFGWW